MKVRKGVGLVLLVAWLGGAGILLSGCATAEHHGKAHWGYHGEIGPKHWGDLSPDYILARTGKQQSPIDIPNVRKAKGLPFKTSYKTTGLSLVNNGHAIQVNCDEGSTLQVGNVTYDLKQFHFHSPSENTVNGKHFDMECHLVHLNAKGEIAVIGVLFKKGAENGFLAKFWGRMPGEAGSEVKDEKVQLNIVDLLPKDQSCYAFMGSLTTPPCTEGVKWYLLSTPVEMSAGQLTAFQKLYKDNYRPVQPLNERRIIHYVQ